MIVAGTGHRPNKLGGYSDSAFDALCEIIHDWLDENPELMNVLEAASGLSDMFGQLGHVCQATELWRIKEEKNAQPQ